MYSGATVVRSSITGKHTKSAVHRPIRQQKFLQSAGDQIHILKLQGFMFFGTINQLDQHIHSLLQGSSQLRYIILDFALISGIDYSATEAFHELRKVFQEKRCHLIFCNMNPKILSILAKSNVLGDETYSFPSDEETAGHVNISASSTAINISTTRDEEVWKAASDFVHVFKDLNEALEWCENNLLAYFYKQRDLMMSGMHDVTPSGSPRDAHIRRVASDVLLDMQGTGPEFREAEDSFGNSAIFESLYEIAAENGLLSDQPSESGLLISEQEFVEICELFSQVLVHSGNVLWSVGDVADVLFVVESGELTLISRPKEVCQTVETLLRGAMVTLSLLTF